MRVAFAVGLHAIDLTLTNCRVAAVPHSETSFPLRLVVMGAAAVLAVLVMLALGCLVHRCMCRTRRGAKAPPRRPVAAKRGAHHSPAIELQVQRKTGDCQVSQPPQALGYPAASLPMAGPAACQAAPYAVPPAAYLAQAPTVVLQVGPGAAQTGPQQFPASRLSSV